MQETRFRPLGQEDPLEEGMATHSSILAWRIPWTEEPGGLQSIGSQRVGHNWSDLACVHVLLSVSTFIIPSFKNFIFLFYFFMFRLCRTACGILVSWLGMEPLSPAVEAQRLNCYTTREVWGTLLRWGHLASPEPGPSLQDLWTPSQTDAGSKPSTITWTAGRPWPVSGYYNLVFSSVKRKKTITHLRGLYKDQTHTDTKNGAWHHQCHYSYSSRRTALTQCKGGSCYHPVEDAVSWDKSPGHRVAGLHL